jgi:hypothetical protein
MQGDTCVVRLRAPSKSIDMHDMAQFQANITAPDQDPELSQWDLITRCATPGTLTRCGGMTCDTTHSCTRVLLVQLIQQPLIRFGVAASSTCSVFALATWTMAALTCNAQQKLACQDGKRRITPAVACSAHLVRRRLVAVHVKSSVLSTDGWPMQWRMPSLEVSHTQQLAAGYAHIRC